jgi:hypothetical protein
MARRPNPVLHALWRDRIHRHLTSGLSVEQFCAQGRFARSAFYRWKHRLGLMSRVDQCSTPPPSISPSTFLPVTVRLLENDASHPAPIEADLPNGVRLRIPTADALLACRIVRAVAGAKTNAGGSK